MNTEVEHFLNNGGRIQSVARGISGKNPDDPPLFLNRRLFDQPRTPRTPVPEVIAAIEARRLANAAGKKHPRKGRRRPSRRRKVIYDDFGEPLRRVWIESEK